MQVATKKVKYHAIIRHVRGKVAGFWRHLRDALACAARAAARNPLGHLGVFLALTCVAPGSLQARAPSESHENGIGAIAVSELPPEARAVLRSIKTAGPFRYSKDGSVFGNRERRLPQQPYGYYREYTVPTPGARDRGPRRIIAGRDAHFYYTDDHYRRFKRILE